jgi:DNA (cytosine-5)-methyltransferase 1
MAKANKKSLRVVELFAGVGGFHLGLAGHPSKPNGLYEVVWFNQWEPGTKKQHAHDVYTAKFPSPKEGGHTNTDIAEVVRLAKAGDFKIPDHDLLVGGFPCQDYSVARTLSQAAGIGGKKGVLWWSIRDILELKIKEGKPIPYLFLENVDRLLKSPVSQRGRDFAIILASLSDLGYTVEWRVINAADYGMPQRRRRIFIVAYHSSTKLAKKMTKLLPDEIIRKNGVIASAFPVREDIENAAYERPISGEYPDITENFNTEKPKISPFGNAGFMTNRIFSSYKVAPDYDGDRATLAKILQKDSDVPEEYYLDPKHIKQWEYLKGAKNEPRSVGTPREFIYKEGGMIFPEALNGPSRTVITSEGGPTPSRFKHVVKTKKGLRRLTPIELERLGMFPDGHTHIPGMPDSRRAFFIGNALVVGVIEGIGKSLAKAHASSLNPSSKHSTPARAASPSSARAPKSRALSSRLS